MHESTLDPDDLQRPDWNSLKKNYDKHDVGEAYFKGRVEQMGLHVEHWGIDMRNHDDHLIFDDRMDLRLWEPVDGQEQPPDRWPSDVGEGDHSIARYEVAHTDKPGAIEAARSHPVTTEDEIQAAFDVKAWECRALIDVKTKANPDWLGITNLRHLAHYGEWAYGYSQHGVPVAIYMTMVDMDSETVGEQNILVPISGGWTTDILADHYDPDHETSLSWSRRKEIAEGFPIVERAFKAPDGNDVVKFREDYYENFDWFVEEVLG